MVRQSMRKVLLSIDFVGIHSGKHIPDEQAELIKYTKLKVLATILFEYAITLVFLASTNYSF